MTHMSGPWALPPPAPPGISARGWAAARAPRLRRDSGSRSGGQRRRSVGSGCRRCPAGRSPGWTRGTRGWAAREQRPAPPSASRTRDHRGPWGARRAAGAAAGGRGSPPEDWPLPASRRTEGRVRGAPPAPPAQHNSIITTARQITRY